jgi:hypothetical protein
MTKLPTLFYETIGIGNSLPVYGDIMYAIDGFEAMDYQLRPFSGLDYRVQGTDFLRDYRAGDVVVGSLATMRKHFQSLDSLPPDIDYPETIDPVISGRVVVKTRLHLAESWFKNCEKVFIKPVRCKLPGFTAKPYTKEDYDELIRHLPLDTEVFVTACEEYRAEYRVFVHRSEIVDIRRYHKTAGAWALEEVDYPRVAAMVGAYGTAPVAYTLDVAVTSEGETVLVEVNDFWAVGAYGLDPRQYAQMLKDRYTQILVRRR